MISQRPATPEVDEQPKAAETAINTPRSPATPAQEGVEAPVDMHAIRRGWDVLASDGEKVGEALALSHALSGGDGYLIVQQRRFILKKDFYVPAAKIASTSDQRVVLTMTKKDVEASGWDSPPGR